MSETIAYRFRLRRRTAASWASLNEVLLDSEAGIESDTKRGKIGDGVTGWNSLPYTFIGEIDFTGLADGDILKWDDSAGQWIVGPESGGGSGGYLDPRTHLIDPLYDFLAKPPTITGSEPGASYPWMLSRRDGTSSITSQNGGAAAPGVWRMETGSLSTNAIAFSLGDVPNIVLGGGEIRIPLRFRVPVLSNGTDRFVLSLGLADSHGGGVNHGVRLSYTDNVNSGKFDLIATAGGTSSTGHGGTALVANTFYACEIVINAAGTQADLYVNGSLEATCTSNLPTAALLLGSALFKTVGNNTKSVEFDYIAPPQKVFTTSR